MPPILSKLSLGETALPSNVLRFEVFCNGLSCLIFSNAICSKTYVILHNIVNVIHNFFALWSVSWGSKFDHMVRLMLWGSTWYACSVTEIDVVPLIRGPGIEGMNSNIPYMIGHTNNGYIFWPQSKRYGEKLFLSILRTDISRYYSN